MNNQFNINNIELKKENEEESTSPSVKIVKYSMDFCLVLCLMLLFISSAAKLPSNIIFIPFVITVSLAIFVRPLMESLKQHKNNFFKTVEIVSLTSDAIIMIAFIYCAYLIMFRTEIRWEENSTLYNGTIVCVVLLFTSRWIKDFIKKLSNARNNREKLIKYLGIIFMQFISFIFAFVIPFYAIYEPVEIITLNNIEKPYALEIVLIKETPSMENFLKNKYKESKRTITDEKIIESFYNELKDSNITNVRHLESIRYELLKEKSYPYYEIRPLYKSLKGRAYCEYIEEGYLSEIKILRTGEVFTLTENPHRNFFNGRFTRIFKLPLSKSIIESIKENKK